MKKIDTFLWLSEESRYIYIYICKWWLEYQIQVGSKRSLDKGNNRLSHNSRSRPSTVVHLIPFMKNSNYLSSKSTFNRICHTRDVIINHL